MTSHAHALVKKVVLAFSGGLDTSVILRWLQETYACEVVTFTAGLGQAQELEPSRAKAQRLGRLPQRRPRGPPLSARETSRGGADRAGVSG